MDKDYIDEGGWGRRYNCFKAATTLPEEGLKDANA
jgi:hypothetical protein